MKKKTDKIDSLLSAYKKKAAGRIEAEKKADARYDAMERAQNKFIEDVKKKISGTVRPAMKTLLDRLNKKDFSFAITKGIDDNYYCDSYRIKGKVEKGLELVFQFKLHVDLNKVVFFRSYCFRDYDSENVEFQKFYRLDEINHQLVKRLFIAGLQKICL